jgi:polysaccharide pyruvyl transferase WcaK-like protein
MPAAGRSQADTPASSSTGLRPIRVGLLWHSVQSANLGVGALTLANIALAREAARDVGLRPDFVIVGMRDDGSRAYPGMEATERLGLDFGRLISPTGCWARFATLDCLLDIGAGDSFADIYGGKRFFFLWWTKMLAIARRRPLLLSPQTVGPFERRLSRRLAGLALARSDAVVTRDQESLSVVRALAPRARAVTSVDVAFALPHEDRSALRGGARLRVGVNVSGLLHAEAESGRNRFGLQADYAQMMRRCLAELAARRDVEVHLICHVRGSTAGADDDEPIARRLAAEFPGAVLAPRFEGPSEAKSYISSLDFLVAARMHACIAAYSTGVPVVPIAYSRKFSGLFNLLGYRWLVPERGVDACEATQFIMDCLARRADLSNDISEGLARVESLLEAYRDELRRFFMKAAA